MPHKQAVYFSCHSNRIIAHQGQLSKTCMKSERSRAKAFFVFFLFLNWSHQPLHGQKLAETKVPLDTAVKVGKLKNGFTYYIRKNQEPRNRAELRLIVKAGSILETDAQQGLAHFMEHMNFNGTAHFPKNQLVDFLQKIGVRFGADLNAYTGFDETVYMLPIPTDSAGLLSSGIQILEDWAHGALLDVEEIDKERGVVLEESRMGRGAQQRMRDRYLKMILNNSRYADRLPIGKDSILKKFNPAVLKAFYKDWYRPDLMALVAVGDFDPVEVERLIREKFGRIRMPANPRKRVDYKIPLDGSTKVAVVTDAEFPQNVVQLMYKLPKSKEVTLADTRREVIQSLFNSMLDQRIQELTQKADPPFIYGNSSYGSFLADLDAFSCMALAKDPSGVEKALVSLLEENERILKFGFTDTELQRAKSSFMNSMERYYNERDKWKSSQHVEEYKAHFLDGKPFMGMSAYYQFLLKHISGISLQEVNALAGRYISDKNRAVVIMGPEKGKAQLPDDAEVLRILREAGKEVEAYKDEVINEPLLPALPSGSAVTKVEKSEKLGVTEWTLGNGVKVLLKPTDFKNDQILFQGTARGGYSLFPKEPETGSFASYLVQSGGVGGFNQTQLQKFLSGKTASVNPYISELSEGVSGRTNPKDLETALQLVYAYFTAPRKDASVVQGILANQKNYLTNLQNTITPEKVFSDTLSALLTSYHPSKRPLTPERVDLVDLDRAMEIYKDRFSDASDFVFTFVGSFTPEVIKPLIVKYLGGLPSTERNDSYHHPGIRPLKGAVERTVFKGVEPKSRVSLVFSGDYDYTPENNIQMDALSEVLQIKLIEALREEESGVYGVGVSERLEKIPTGNYRISIGFGCAPENVEKLIKRTLQEVDKIKKGGADPKDIEKYVAERKRKREIDIKSNEFWLGFLDSKMFYDENPEELLRQNDYLMTVTSATTRTMATRYLNTDHLIKVVLMPEKP